MKKIDLNTIIRRAGKFQNLEAARRWASAGDRPTWIVMGDHDGETGVYWTVRPVDVARLERAGYELVNVLTTANWPKGSK